MDTQNIVHVITGEHIVSLFYHHSTIGIAQAEREGEGKGKEGTYYVFFYVFTFIFDWFYVYSSIQVCLSKGLLPNQLERTCAQFIV